MNRKSGKIKAIAEGLPVAHFNRLVALLAALLCVGCVEPERAKRAEPSLIQLRARSDYDVPLEGLEVSLVLEAKGEEQGRQEQKLLLTNAEGEAEGAVPIGSSAVIVEAKCPENYSGEPLRRRIPRALVLASSVLSFDLACTQVYADVTVAVLSAGCAELEIFLDDVQIGQTESGFLHVLERRKAAGVMTLRAKSIDPDCKLEEPSQLFEFDAGVWNIWARFDGEAIRRRRRSSGLRAKKVHRPYKL